MMREKRINYIDSHKWRSYANFVVIENSASRTFCHFWKRNRT